MSRGNKAFTQTCTSEYVRPFSAAVTQITRKISLKKGKMMFSSLPAGRGGVVRCVISQAPGAPWSGGEKLCVNRYWGAKIMWLCVHRIRKESTCASPEHGRRDPKENATSSPKTSGRTERCEAIRKLSNWVRTSRPYGEESKDAQNQG